MDGHGARRNIGGTGIPQRIDTAIHIGLRQRHLRIAHRPDVKRHNKRLPDSLFTVSRDGQRTVAVLHDIRRSLPGCCNGSIAQPLAVIAQHEVVRVVAVIILIL